MKFFAVAALFAGALAVPTEHGGGGGGGGGDRDFKCPVGLFNSPQCCATILLGAVGLDCNVPRKGFHDATGLKNVCAGEGKQAACCVLPVAGQAVLCQPASG
ncbi:Hydrophobin-like protein [Tolypocladium paradoxum]|uniref:Hydrophobin-like protein n=1 Tax=Tolypocladium paradoxum TaxID=94208 RepID=A0A2S4KZA5_9HYPO|nr:Hydrophobin-like protein [Tolypocladium paradoxum]